MCLPGAGVERHHLVVIVRHGVGTAAVGCDWSRSHHRHQHLLPLLGQLLNTQKTQTNIPNALKLQYQHPHMKTSTNRTFFCLISLFAQVACCSEILSSEIHFLGVCLRAMAMTVKVKLAATKQEYTTKKDKNNKQE